MKSTWIFLLLLLPAAPVQAGNNFVASGASEEFNRRVEAQAEAFRRQHAIDWLRKPLPGDWFRPCPIRVDLGIRRGGATSFSFDGGQVGGWDMMVSGDADEILTRVLPHEVLHAVFASHFRQKLPRWADEGACTTVEHPDERRRSDQMLRACFRQGRVMPINRLLTLTEYPDDVLPLYWQGHSVVSFLLSLADRPTFVRFLETALSAGNWSTALETCYSIDGPQVLEQKWRCFAIPPAAGPREPLPLSASAANADDRLGADRSNQVAAAGLPRILQPCFRDQQSGPPPQPAEQQPDASAGSYDPYPSFAPQPAVTYPTTPVATPDPEPPATPGPLVNIPHQPSPCPTRPTEANNSVEPRGEDQKYQEPYRGEGSQDGKQNAGGWFQSLQQGLGGGVGLAAGVIVTSVLAGMGIPPVISKLGGVLARRAVVRAESKLARDLGPQLDARFSRIEARMAGRAGTVDPSDGSDESSLGLLPPAGQVVRNHLKLQRVPTTDHEFEHLKTAIQKVTDYTPAIAPFVEQIFGVYDQISKGDPRNRKKLRSDRAVGDVAGATMGWNDS